MLCAEPSRFIELEVVPEIYAVCIQFRPNWFKPLSSRQDKNRQKKIALTNAINLKFIHDNQTRQTMLARGESTPGGIVVGLVGMRMVGRG